MKKKGMMFLLMFILLVSSVFAISTWRMEANADDNAFGGVGFTGYGSNIPNRATDINYSSCEIGGSNYFPIVADFTGDGISEVLISSGSTITLYDFTCRTITELDVGFTIANTPTFFNADQDQNQELYLLDSTNESLHIYEYDLAIGSFVVEQVMYSGCGWGLDFLTCVSHATLDFCLAIGDNDEMVSFFPSLDQIDCHDNTFTTGKYATGSIRNGVSNTRINSNVDFLIPYCMMGNDATDVTIDCGVLNSTTGEAQYIGITGSAGNFITGLSFLSAFYARMGNTYKLFTNVDYAKDGAKFSTNAFSVLGANLYSDSDGDTANQTTNWAVADYNKDGENDACLIRNDIAENKTTFECFDSDFNSMFAVDVENSFNFSKGIVLADFEPSRATLGIGTYKGIYYVNGSNFQNIFSTGEVSSVENSTSVIVITETGSSSPVMIWADSNNGLIVSNNLVSVSCGNGVCEAFENVWSCEEDCNITAIPTNETGASCNNDDDCTFGGCINNNCGLLGDEADCDVDEDCLSGECSNLVCTSPSWWESIDNTKDNVAGDDTNTNNMIALTLTLFFSAIIVIVVAKTGAGVLGAVAGGMTFFALIIFFAIVGWLSPFILLGMIILLVVVIALAVMFSSGGD